MRWNDNSYLRKRDQKNNYGDILESLLKGAVDEKNARKRSFPVDQKVREEDALSEQVVLGNLYL